MVNKSPDKLRIIKFIFRSLYRFIIRSKIISSSRYKYMAYSQDFDIWKKTYCKNDIPVFPGISLDERSVIYEYLNRDILKGGPIDYLEFGVYRGNSIKAWAEINKNPQSRFFGFDSFEGLPENWLLLSKGAFDTTGKIPSIDDERVSFVKGIFQDKLPSFIKSFSPNNRLVIHLDADLYSSTLFVLTTMDRFIVSNAILIFDEFFYVVDEFKGFMDYTQAYLRNYKVLAFTKDYNQMAILIK